MEFSTDFKDLDLADLHSDAQARQSQGWRYVQILAVNLEDGIDLVYSYMKDGLLENVCIRRVSQEDVIPSISDIYFEAFVCENEIHDLFGLKIEGIAIDFLGNFYKVAESYPMTIITPEQAAAREKAKKLADAKSAKAAERSTSSESDDLEAKLKDMPPEKAAQVRAAMEAKAKKAAQDKDAELEEKLKGLPPEKAEKVRAAYEAKKKAAKEAE